MAFFAVMRCLVFVVGFLCASANIWETARRRDHLSFVHHVPSKEVTALRIARNFLGFRGLNTYALRRFRRDEPEKQLTKPEKQVPKEEYNVVYMVDSSNSIRPKGFRREKIALRMLTDKANPNTHYSAITFSTTAEISFKYANRTKAKEHLMELPYFAGKTNTQEAMRLAEMIFFNTTNGPMKPGRKRILIFTDGQSNVKEELTLYRAFRLKKRGVEIFVVGVGKYLYGMHEIIALATSSSHHLFRVKNMKDFVKIIKMIPKFDEFKYADNDGNDFEYISFPTPKP